MGPTGPSAGLNHGPWMGFKSYSGRGGQVGGTFFAFFILFCFYLLLLFLFILLKFIYFTLLKFTLFLLIYFLFFFAFFIYFMKILFAFNRKYFDNFSCIKFYIILVSIILEVYKTF